VVLAVTDYFLSKKRRKKRRGNKEIKKVQGGRKRVRSAGREEKEKSTANFSLLQGRGKKGKKVKGFASREEKRRQ